MPKGGRRIGAGRKPGVPNRIGRRVVDMAGRPFAAPVLPVLGPAPEDAARLPLAEPPAGMGEAEAAVWRELAPHAISQQTLVAGTVRGFRELCELAVLKGEIVRVIFAAGAATTASDGLLRQYTKLSQRLEAALARYRLTAQGKPEPSAAVKPKAASPWAMAVGGK